MRSTSIDPYPTDDVRLLTRAAVDAVDQVFRPGFNYSKAEVLLLNLCQPGEFTSSNPDWRMRREEMMSQSYTTRLDQLWNVSCR